jgi:hypothetical protein
MTKIQRDNVIDWHQDRAMRAWDEGNLETFARHDRIIMWLKRQPVEG